MLYFGPILVRQDKILVTIRGLIEVRDALATSAASTTPLTGDEILSIHQGVELDTPQWLPDGSGIIFRSSVGGSSDFWCVEPDGGPLRRLTVHSGGQAPRVSPDGRWLAYLSNRSGCREVWIHPLAGDLGADARQLTAFRADVNTASWAPDSRSMAISCNRYGSYDTFEVDVPSSTWQRLTSNSNRHEQYPVYLPDGNRIAFVRLSENWEDHEIVVTDRRGSSQQIVARDEDFFDYQLGRRFGHPLISPDGRRLLFRSHRSNWINYWQLELGATSEPTPLHPEDFDQACESGSITCGEACWSPDGRRVAFLSNRNGNVQLRVVSSDGGASTVVAADGEGVASHPQWSPDGRWIAFLYQSFLAPADIWVAEVTENDRGIIASGLRQLTDSMPVGLARKFNTPEKVHYESFDGTRIPAYVYRPTQVSKDPGAAIIEVHGGPWDQFRDTMHVVIQFYVQRGYTVLLPNIRGSSGYGKEFQEKIQSGWGVDDLKDLSAGAQYLVARGLADPHRIGVTGQSYGGSMAMAAAVFAPPGTFQAAVSRVGYADWHHYTLHGGQASVKLLRHVLGDPQENQDLYIRSSPLRWTQQAHLPILVIDQESPPGEPSPDQREAFVKRLKSFNKPAWYKKYASTGGPYARSEAGAKQMLPDVIKFFKAYLG